MKSIKTLSTLTLFVAFIAMQACKKDKTVTPAGFTFDGVKYTTVKSYIDLNGASFGSTYYSALTDSAVNDDKTKAIVFKMIFNKVGRPTSGNDYYVYVPSGLPASTPDLITTIVYGVNFANSHYTLYDATNSGTDQTATVTNDGKITVDFPATSFDGTEYDSGGSVVKTIPSFLFSNTTFKEQ